MTRDEAITTFRRLVELYGLQWRADVPAEAWTLLTECNEHLSGADRRMPITVRNPSAPFG
jgi:hypothetical protein